jgi:arginase
MRKMLDLIGAPSSAGAYAPGQEKAPAAWRRHGLREEVIRAGWQLEDRGDVSMFRWRPDLDRPKAMNLDAVVSTALAVADLVSESMVAGRRALVLGGDCTVELGTVAGALRAEKSVGLIYIDFDADLNIPDTSDGALDWTGVAHLLGIEGAAADLVGLGPRTPMLRPDDVLFLAVANITPSEALTMQSLGLEVLRLQDVKADPRGAAERARRWAKAHACLLVHLDADVLSYTHCPIAENVRRCDGLALDELCTVLTPLLAMPNWRALTVTEVNPDHAPDETEIFRRLIETLGTALRA